MSQHQPTESKGIVQLNSVTGLPIEQPNEYSASDIDPTISDPATSDFSVEFTTAEGVLDSGADYKEVSFDEHNGYYSTPYSPAALNRLFDANGHHSSCRDFKAMMLAKFFKATDNFTYQDFYQACIDLCSFGHCTLQRIYNSAGFQIGYQHIPTLAIRKGKKNRFVQLQKNADPIKFKPNEINQLRIYDPSQPHYGRPQYIGSIQSILLNESATLFRRRYYINGNHAGFIMYSNDPHLSKEAVTELKSKIKGTKGVGNFKSMFVHVPGGDENAIKIMPIGDKATADDFPAMKRVSQDDIFAAWRIPAELAGVAPTDKSGRGDSIKAAKVFVEMEILPLLPLFETLNSQLHPSFRFTFDTPETGVFSDSK